MIDALWHETIVVLNYEMIDERLLMNWIVGVMDVVCFCVVVMMNDVRRLWCRVLLLFIALLLLVVAELLVLPAASSASPRRR